MTTALTAQARPTVRSVLFRFQSLFGLVAVFVAAIVFSPTRNGELLFLSSGNLFNVVRAISEKGIIAVGMTFVILIGGIDLSVGAVLGLTAVGSADLLVNHDWGVVPTVLVVLLVGLVFGLSQGFASTAFRIQAFIVTLAGLQIARGLARIWSGGRGSRSRTAAIPVRRRWCSHCSGSARSTGWCPFRRCSSSSSPSWPRFSCGAAPSPGTSTPSAATRRPPGCPASRSPG
ncbi:hypothetical protein GCM10029964_095870 [Kibdelosporangium lantanae]